MAKIKAPLFSLDAVGSLSKNITYRKKSQSQTASKYAKPGDKIPFESSPRQKDQRSIIGLITCRWQCFSNSEKLSWETAAKDARFKGTGYHYFLHKAQTNLTQYLGLVGYWSMNYNVGNKIPDLSGNNNNGILSPTYPTDCPTLAPSINPKFGKASFLDGINDVILIPNFGFFIPVSEISIELIIKLGGTSSRVDDLIAPAPFTISNRIQIHCPWSSFIHWQFGDPYSNVTTSFNPDWDSLFNYFVFTASISNNFMKIYRNTIQLVTGPISNPYTQTAGLDLRIGGRPAYPFFGLIDEVRIWDRALSPKEILLHYNLFK